jgi:para-nitrobenzyl esterase
MLVGTVSEEGMQYKSNLTEAEWQASLIKTYGNEKAVALIAAMKKAHPENEYSHVVVWYSGLKCAQQRAAHGEAQARAGKSACLSMPGSRLCLTANVGVVGG